MNVLGVDYGERYIGLAVYAAKKNASFALKVIDTKKEDLIKSLEEVVEEYKITKIAVGYPIGLNNNQTRMSGLTDEFIENVVTNILKIESTKVDERMTSVVITKSKKDRIDDISALQILETYLANV